MLSFSCNFVNSIFVSFFRFASFFIPVLFLLLLLPFNTWNVPETFIEFTRRYSRRNSFCFLFLHDFSKRLVDPTFPSIKSSNSYTHTRSGREEFAANRVKLARLSEEIRNLISNYAMIRSVAPRYSLVN